MLPRLLACAVLPVALVLLQTPDLDAQAKTLKPIKTWNGRVSVEQQKEGPKRNYIVSEKELTRVWKAWKVKDEMPKVDFDKQLVLVVTSRSSGLGLTPRLEENGDLKVIAFATADLRPDYAFQFGLIPREGIKTIEGKAIEKE